MFKKIFFTAVALAAFCSVDASFMSSPIPTKLKDLPDYTCETSSNWCSCFSKYMSDYCTALDGGDACKTDASVRILLRQAIADLGIATICTVYPIGTLSEPQCEQAINNYLNDCSTS